MVAESLHPAHVLRNLDETGYETPRNGAATTAPAIDAVNVWKRLLS